MNKKLTTWEAACVITGYGIGGGVLSLPALAVRIGLLQAFLILLLAFLVSYVIHLMIADLALKTEEGGQIITCLSIYLFRGKYKKALTLGFFILMLAVFCANLTGYILGAEEIITGLIPVSPVAARLLFYSIAAAVVFWGLKAVGISEKYAMAAIFLLIGVLTGASLLSEGHSIPLFISKPDGALAFYGMAMFSLSAFFSVPQAVEGLEKDHKKIRKALFLGFFNNLVIIMAVCFSSLYASERVTSVAMVGWAEGIGLWARIAGGVFTILAMLTTYWSLSLALSDIIRETAGTGTRLSWFLSTFPTLLLSMFRLGGFLEFMRLAGGIISIVIACMIIPAFMNARKDVPDSILKHNGNLVCALMMAAFLLMGIGNLIPV